MAGGDAMTSATPMPPGYDAWRTAYPPEWDVADEEEEPVCDYCGRHRCGCDELYERQRERQDERSNPRWEDVP